MTTKLLSSDVWKRITSLAQKHSKKCHIAVAYFGKHGSKLLPLRQGSVLVVDMSRKAVCSGQTDPSAIINLLNRGVDVHSVENLHAKVFVLGNHAIVGSTNASRHSANDLIEAAIETIDEITVADCRDFVLDLAGEYVTLQDAQKMKSLYKPPNFGKGKGATPKHAPLWVISLVRGDWDSEDNIADKAGVPSAKEELRSSRFYRIDKFKWEGESLLGKLQKRDQLLQIIKIGKTRYVYPAGRILHVEQYKVRNGSRAIVYLEVPKKLKRKKLVSVVEHLGEPAKLLKRIKYFKLLKNAALVHDLLKLWPRGITPRTIPAVTTSPASDGTDRAPRPTSVESRK